MVSQQDPWKMLGGTTHHKSWLQNMCHTHSWPQHIVKIENFTRDLMPFLRGSKAHDFEQKLDYFTGIGKVHLGPPDVPLIYTYNQKSPCIWLLVKQAAHLNMLTAEVLGTSMMVLMLQVGCYWVTCNFLIKNQITHSIFMCIVGYQTGCFL